MGLTVVLEDENGTALGSAEDPANVLHRLLPNPEDTSFPVLKFIDWYGDTVINRLQLEAFLQEWDRIAQKILTADEKLLLSRIRDLATRAQQQQHTYLKFYGD
jgi:hypothetical protein